MSCTVIYDACVLYPAPLRDLLLELPDANDRHVLAAAIKCNARIIVTINLKDFPTESLNPYGIEAMHPDEFIEHGDREDLLHDHGLSPQRIAETCREMANAEPSLAR